LAQPEAQLQHQRRLATAHRSADAHGESALVEIAVEGPIAVMKVAGMIVMLMGVAVFVMVVAMVNVHNGDGF
jgi:hypothetical protein